MFPTITEPRPYIIVVTENTVQRSHGARERALSQLTLVSLRIPHSETSDTLSDGVDMNNNDNSGRARCDD